MITHRERAATSAPAPAPAPTGLPDSSQGAPTYVVGYGSSIPPAQELPTSPIEQGAKIAKRIKPWQKPVKSTPRKSGYTQQAAVLAKHLAIQKRSILSNSSATSSLPNKRANTLLDQPLSGDMDLVRWKDTRDEFIKLASAATPLYWMAKDLGWELKAFTLVLTEELSRRFDDGDAKVIAYLRDEMVRRTKAVLGTGSEFLYGVEKAPKVFSDSSSRRRWHLHGLIIGPTGFAAHGKCNPLRRALSPLKGEADADLMFQIPGKKIDSDQRSSAVRWCFYAAKNGLTLQLNPALAGAYDIPPGKQSYISTGLRREAQRWHDGALAGRTSQELRNSKA